MTTSVINYYSQSLFKERRLIRCRFSERYVIGGLDIHNKTMLIRPNRGNLKGLNYELSL
jgi:hypothetical protein